jgi:hypothetical protein
MDIKSMMKELLQLQKRASVDLDMAPWQTKPSLTIMKREAQEALDKLKTEYLRRVRANSLGIFVTGDPTRVAEFVKIAGEEAGVLTIDAGEMYRRLALRVESSLGASREFGPTQLDILNDTLKLLGNEMGIRSMMRPNLREVTVVKTQDAVLTYIRKLIQTVLGNDLIRLFLNQKIDQKAISAEFTGNTLPIAVTGIDQSELASLGSLFTNSVSVEVGTSEDGEVNQEYVLKKLTSFKKLLKSKSNQ